jgi:hypothetical protein
MHYRDRAHLERIRDLEKVVSVTATLIHELQKERGLSSGFVAGGSRKFALELAGQTARCIESEQNAQKVWSTLVSGPGTSGLEAALGVVQDQLAELPRLREDIRDQALTPNSVVQRFSLVVDRLLVVMAEAPGTSPHPQVTLTLIAFFNFILAKEYTGQLRALGSAVCAQGVFEPFQYETFLLYQKRREETLEVFFRHASKDQWEAWEALKTTVPFRAFQALFQLLEILGREGQGRIPSADDWFQAATFVIDDLRTFEIGLLADLDALYLQVFAEARSAWEDSQESPEDRDQLALAKLERQHLRLQEERQARRLAERGSGSGNPAPVKNPPRPTLDLATELTRDSDRAVEEVYRTRRDLDSWSSLVDDLSKVVRQTKLLSLDASIEAVKPAQVALQAKELAQKLGTLIQHMEKQFTAIQASTDRTLGAFEEFHAMALKLRRRLIEDFEA